MLIWQHAFGATLHLKTYENTDIVISYEDPLEAVIPNVLSVYPRARTLLRKKLGLDADLRPIIVLIHTDELFYQMVGGNRLVKAFAVPRNNHIYINYSHMERTPFDLELTITHEVCHLLLHNYVEPYHLPRWLDEGISQWVSGGMSDIISYDGKKLLKEAVLSENLISLQDMNLGFSGRADLFKLSYEESRSIVEYIDAEYGTESLMHILDRLRRGFSIDAAISDSLSISLSTLELKWSRRLTKKYTWYAYAADHIIWILFTVAALLTLIGYLRLRIRMKSHFEDTGDDEFTEFK